MAARSGRLHEEGSSCRRGERNQAAWEVALEDGFRQRHWRDGPLGHHGPSERARLPGGAAPAAAAGCQRHRTTENILSDTKPNPRIHWGTAKSHGGSYMHNMANGFSTEPPRLIFQLPFHSAPKPTIEASGLFGSLLSTLTPY